MKRANSRSRSDLEDDLKHLSGLAYHRLESSEDLVRRFYRFTRTAHANSDHLQKLYDWLFVPITLWPIDIEGILRAALDRVASGRRLDNRMLLLIDLLRSPPSDKTQRAVSEHERLVQRGRYEPLIRARHKYNQIESELARDPTSARCAKAGIKAQRESIGCPPRISPCAKALERSRRTETKR
ncbi:MAG: hypothetical protein DME51_13415 [Verrucomicrobia bacterium]|nr:MAG: hypothetical protein DME51_13415 [Verrucomicrobiota bacterium]